MKVTVGYVILAHQDPHLVARLARLLVKHDGIVAIHYDLQSNSNEFTTLRAELKEDVDRILWPKRVHVAWGEWSIVQATLNALEAIAASGRSVDFVHLMSGTDYPIRPISEFSEYLARQGADFIECTDMVSERWVMGGLTHERYQYRHYLNWKHHPALFELCWRTQQLFSLKRSFPKGLRPHLGSQWWTLTWRSVQAVLAAGRDRRLRSFFKTTWIPDELFIQSVVAGETGTPAQARTLTLYQFSDNGVPIVYYNDHADYLARQPFFFARKLSRHANNLRDILDEHIGGARPVERFTDSDLGVRTNEYRTYVEKWGKPSRDVHPVGYEKDSWYGDLAYRDAPVVAVFGATHRELRAIADLLNGSGHVLCHGTLFHPDRIEFAGGVQRFAGYACDDVALRDNSRTTFLSDIIKDAQGNTTVALLLPWTMDEHIRDRLVWSPFSRNLIVRGNVLRAFEEYLDREAKNIDGNDEEDCRKDGTNTDGGAFGKFQKEYVAYHTQLEEDLSNAQAYFKKIDLMSADWRHELAEFLEDIQTVSHVTASELATSFLETIPPGRPVLAGTSQRRLSNEIDVIETIEPLDRRMGHLRDYANSSPVQLDQPFFAILGTSPEELQFVGRILDSLGTAFCHGALFAKDQIEFSVGVSHYAGYDKKDVALRDSDRAHFVRAVSSAAKLSRGNGVVGFILPWTPKDSDASTFAIWHELSKIIIVRGNIIRTLAERRRTYTSDLVSSSQVHSFLSEYSKYYTDIRAQCEAAHADFEEIDLMRNDWLQMLLSFSDRPRLDEIQSVRQYISQQANLLSDPFPLVRNPARVIRAIDSEDRREAHFLALETSLSKQRRAHPVKPVLERQDQERLIDARDSHMTNESVK